MDICCAFAPTMETPAHIELAEHLGYRRAWVFDTPAVQLDVWATLALAAVRTHRIGLGPGVLIPSLRNVMVNASAAAMLVGLAPGRVDLAVGSGFSGCFAMGQRPNKWAFVASYAQQLRALLAGETVEVDGAMTRMLHGDGQAPSRPIELPLLLGTAGPLGESYARKIADGVFTVIPIQGFERQSLLKQGTVLEPGESFDSPRVLDAAGGGCVGRVPPRAGPTCAGAAQHTRPGRRAGVAGGDRSHRSQVSPSSHPRRPPDVSQLHRSWGGARRARTRLHLQWGSE